MAKSTLFSGTTGGTIKDTDIMAYKEEGASGDPKRIHLFSAMKSYFQGLLPDRVTQNELDISVLRPSAGTANQFVSAGGLFIPLYIYPANIYTNDDFNQVIDIARANNSLNVLTTINPGNGPGTVVDGNYTVAIDRLHSAGVVVTGYVSTAYTANTIEDVKLDIDKWIELYPEIDGIFLDEMTNDAVVAHYEYYQELTTYTKQSGLTITISNPGSTCGRPYFDYNCADIIFTREVSTFPTVAEAHEDWADGAASYFNKRRGLIVYNNSEVNAFAGLDEIYPYYGWFYVTDDDLPNPYDTLPTYFEALADKVSGLGVPSSSGSSTALTDVLKTLTTNQWDDGTKVVATDPEFLAYFGGSVSISGDYAVVGANSNNTEGNDAGAAYIYHMTDGVWDSGVKIVAPDPVASAYFGGSVAIDGDYVVIGAKGKTSNTGAAYIFNRTGLNTWDAGVMIVATDSSETLDYFGVSVSISGDYVIVGANGEDTEGSAAGAAYIFNRTGLNTWDAGTKVVATDPETLDSFGISVSIDGDYAVVGAYKETSSTGAAYIFNRTALNTWDAGIKIVATDGEVSDYFGNSVSISGDYVIVGAYGEDAEGSVAGAAYIFDRTGLNTWGYGIKIVSPDPEASDYFGDSVSISGDYAIISSHRKYVGSSSAGAAYIFNRTGLKTWGNGVMIVATDGESNDYFSGSVAIDGDYVIIGSEGEDSSGANDAGAAYIYYETFQSLINKL